jgi:hypothetical protein
MYSADSNTVSLEDIRIDDVVLNEGDPSTFVVTYKRFEPVFRWLMEAAVGMAIIEVFKKILFG